MENMQEESTCRWWPGVCWYSWFTTVCGWKCSKVRRRSWKIDDNSNLVCLCHWSSSPPLKSSHLVCITCRSERSSAAKLLSRQQAAAHLSLIKFSMNHLHCFPLNHPIIVKLILLKFISLIWIVHLSHLAPLHKLVPAEMRWSVDAKTHYHMIDSFPGGRGLSENGRVNMNGAK